MTTKTKAATSGARTVAPEPVGAPPPATPKGTTLKLPREARDLPYDKLAAQLAVDGIVGNARSLVSFGSPTFGELSLTECAGVLTKTAKGLNDGDLSAAVTMLSCQAVALNAMFGELARRSGLNMGEHLGATETYMRLALKAQSQCRATLETLAAIKNPPVVFARQANINNGGQQQVNNGPATRPTDSPQSRAPVRPGETVSRPNELLEDRTHGSPQLDNRATAAAGRTSQGLEAVGTFNRPAKR